MQCLLKWQFIKQLAQNHGFIHYALEIMHIKLIVVSLFFSENPSIDDIEHYGIIMSTPVTLSVGDKSPNFDCIDSAGQSHSLQQYMNDGIKIILYFYPRDSTPGCTKQACDFRDNLARLTQHGYAVLGVSKDSESSHAKFINKQELNFPLLMDTEGTLHEMFGTWRMKKNYGKEYLGCVRSTFVIDENGEIAWCRYNVRAKGHVEMLMRELEIQS